MKKPETNTNSANTEKKGFKEFWANKSTRWTIIVFAVILVVTVAQIVAQILIK